jgi:hypothetical protein
MVNMKSGPVASEASKSPFVLGKKTIRKKLNFLFVFETRLLEVQMGVSFDSTQPENSIELKGGKLVDVDIGHVSLFSDGKVFG